MLVRHPDTYSDQELEAWIRHLIDDQVEEGPRLDYKAGESLELNNSGQHREAAKDISSFANEVGGTIIYGVPEDRTHRGTALPVKPYGMDPIPGIESRLENVWVSAIRPGLAEWRVRRVDLTQYPGRVVYVAWTPESWIKPHMVEAYDDRRYYRRGQLRAVPMAEHEVRAALQRSASLYDTVEVFLSSPAFDYIVRFLPPVFNDDLRFGFRSHYILCPAMLIPDRVDFVEQEMREWLRRNPYPTSWQPSSNGVRTNIRTQPASGQWDPIGEIHRTGAISLWKPTQVSYGGEGQPPRWLLAYVVELSDILEFLRFCTNFYARAAYFGPIHLLITVDLPPDVMLYLPPATYRPSRWDSRPLITAEDGLRIRLMIPAADLFDDPRKVLKVIAARLFQAYGLWEADCFNASGDLI